MAEKREEHREDAEQPAHYEAHVEQYAHYDRSGESGYDEATQNNLRYAAQTPFSRFFLDFVKILTRPGAFWKGQSEHPASIGQLHWPHLTVLVFLRTAAGFVGEIMQPGADVVQLLMQALYQVVLIFVSIWILALMISGILSLSGGGFHYEKAVRFVGYSVTPMLFVGMISILPFSWMPAVCDLLAMPWAFVVMGAGVLPYLQIRSESAPSLTGLFCGLMLCVWGALPMALPYLFFAQ